MRYNQIKQKGFYLWRSYYIIIDNKTKVRFLLFVLFNNLLISITMIPMLQDLYK